MKKGINLFGGFIEIMSSCLCLIAITAPVAITITSLLGVIEKTQKQDFWRIVFFAVFFGLFIISICFAVEYAFISCCGKATLHQLFSENTLPRLLRIAVILDHGLPLLTLITGINMIFAMIIWKGDGHGLHGTWLFTAGGTPIGISLIAMIPLTIQRKALELASKKMGKSKSSSYD